MEGLFRKPTVVNNVETVACVKHILDRGRRLVPVDRRARRPRTIPATRAASGRSSTALSGHVEKPGCYEAPLGITVRELIDELRRRRLEGTAGQGGRSPAASAWACWTGRTGLSARLRRARAVGCLGLGTAAVVVMDETVSIVDFLHNSARFFAHESCGQCTPCREGTSWALRMLERIRAGQGRLIDLDLLLEIGDTIGIMPGTRSAAWPTEPPGRSRTRSASSATSSKTTSSGPIRRATCRPSRFPRWN